jgi:hypothetical protein
MEDFPKDPKFAGLPFVPFTTTKRCYFMKKPLPMIRFTIPAK